MDHIRRGRIGEWLALVLLVAKGYRPRHRNWRGAGGELDLVVARGRETVFVEVKLRSSEAFGGAAASVTAEKRRHLSRVASAYLSRFDLWDHPCRFDIVTIERGARFPFWRLRHYRNAFAVDTGRQL
jgi:putative endonuclease